jgi:hypothetical protein
LAQDIQVADEPVVLEPALEEAENSEPSPSSRQSSGSYTLELEQNSKSPSGHGESGEHQDLRAVVQQDTITMRNLQAGNNDFQIELEEVKEKLTQVERRNQLYSNESDDKIAKI